MNTSMYEYKYLCEYISMYEYRIAMHIHIIRISKCLCEYISMYEYVAKNLEIISETFSTNQNSVHGTYD